MDLRPLSYEEMCQMELLHAAGTGSINANAAAAYNTANVSAPNSGSSCANTTTTMLPIMVIPTSMMPPGTILTAAAPAGGNEMTLNAGDCEHYYQLQPTHIITTAAAPTPTAEQQNASAELGALCSTPSTLLQAQPLLLATTTNNSLGGCANEQQHPQQLQQLPQQQQQQQQPATVNILYTGTLTKAPPSQLTHAALTRKALESATLPRGFAPLSSSSAAADESDFEGSECGTSVSTTTCIPHFRFGGCGMILQPAVSTHAHHQPPHAQSHEPHVIGCASLSHMMGSFASAAGGAMQSGRLAGTLAGVGAGLSGTLSRNRRAGSCAAAPGSAAATTQTPKRVSFKADNLPPEEMQCLDEQHSDAGVGGSGSGSGTLRGADAFNNCSYMHFDNFMDYQTTGFGGLPDVTEHSNIRRTLSRQNSISNSDSGGEIASIQKSKVNFGDTKSPPSSHSASAKRKSKAAQQVDSVDAQRYKTRRGSCIIGLTLAAALCLLAIAATLAYQHFFMAPSRNSHAQRLKIVKRILREVPLVDGHNNFAYNVRKYGHSSLELVHITGDLEKQSMWSRPAWAQTDMERLKQGLVGVQVWSAYVPCEAQGLDAVQLALEQIDIIRRLTDLYAHETTLVTTSKDIAAARRRGQMASLIGIEGGHAIGSSLGVLRSFYSLGARYLSLTHKCDVSWAGSSASPLENGLTGFGKAIIREMNRLGMMIDLSYSSDVTARDVLHATRAPVIFSHSAARQLCNSTRNIPDDILRLVAENGGLIMVSFDSEDVACGRQARLADVVAHIKHIRTIAGVQHIGLGAGYDSIELPPVGLEDVSKYPDLLATLLEDPNWSEDDVAMLAGKNFLRIMETVENVRDYWKRAAIQPIEQTEPQPKSQCTYMSS